MLVRGGLEGEDTGVRRHLRKVKRKEGHLEQLRSCTLGHLSAPARSMTRCLLNTVTTKYHLTHTAVPQQITAHLL